MPLTAGNQPRHPLSHSLTHPLDTQAHPHTPSRMPSNTPPNKPDTTFALLACDIGSHLLWTYYSLNPSPPSTSSLFDALFTETTAVASLSSLLLHPHHPH